MACLPWSSATPCYGTPSKCLLTVRHSVHRGLAHEPYKLHHQIMCVYMCICMSVCLCVHALPKWVLSKNPDSATHLYEVNNSNSMATDLSSAYSTFVSSSVKWQ